MPKLVLQAGFEVHIEFTHSASSRTEAYLRSFGATVTEVIDDIEQGTMIRYKRLDGIEVEYPSCNASWVTKIIGGPAYVCKTKRMVNPFTGNAFYVETYGGIKVGNFENLLRLSLSKLDIEFATWLDLDKATALYAKACWPGKTKFQVDQWMLEYEFVAVQWKAFHRWVKKNAQRFFYSKKRMRADIREENEESYRRDYSDIVDDDELQFNLEFDALQDAREQGFDSFPEH